jgi:predicted GNAT superfamily acetyltransferase
MAQIKEVHSIDDFCSLDRNVILSLNNAHAKETSALDDNSLGELLKMAFYARGIDHGATAFLIALDQNAPYWNPNFNWFKEHRESFVYIDRIIVAPSARGQGLAKILYGDLCRVAQQAGHDRVVCEVNIEPPNPVSDAFHLTVGFKEVGKAAIYRGTKTVRYYEKILR